MKIILYFFIISSIQNKTSSLLIVMHKYDILDVIDQGAYGIVWKALNKQNQTFVAIKQFKQSDQDEQSRKAIQRQIKMLKMLKGDFVVGIKQAFKKKGKIYLIFEYFSKNLLNVIQTYQSGVPPKSIKNIVYKVIKCLKFLHNKNIIHRDIKPENILLDDHDQTLKVCDLGFARFIPQNHKQLTDYVATRWYRSPQLLVGQPYGKASDIWALGCIIGELVDGQPMFPGQDQIDQIYLIQKGIGSLTQIQHQYKLQNKKFLNQTFVQVQKKEPIQLRYLGKIQKNALSFMKLCLKMNPEQRITADQALRHPYLIDLSNQNHQFQNDQQNLLNADRKTIVKNQSRASVLSFLNNQQHNEEHIFNEKQHNQQSQLFKTKSFTKNKLNLKSKVGSVDYGNAQNEKKSMQTQKKSLYQKIQKRSVQNIGKINEKQSSPKLKIKKQIKNKLKKNMSQQKNLHVNVDVNFNINLKISKRIGLNNVGSGRNERKTELGKYQSIGSNKLPELKINNNSSNPVAKSIVNKRYNQRTNNLSIFGQSKQLSKGIKKISFGGNL